VKQDIEEKRRKNRVYMKEYQKRNRKILREKEKAYYLANTEKVKATQKRWREANKNYVSAEKKKYRLANLSRVKKLQRNHYLENRQRYLEKAAARYHAKKIEIRNAVREAHQKDPRRRMLIAAKTRAKKKNIMFSLRIEDIVIPTHCPILGIPIAVGNGIRLPNSPSLDRVDSTGPYSVFNCRVISFKANTLKNDGTIEDHERIIAYMKGEL
jgi:hypothetical protein